MKSYHQAKIEAFKRPKTAFYGPTLDLVPLYKLVFRLLLEYSRYKPHLDYQITPGGKIYKLGRELE